MRLKSGRLLVGLGIWATLTASACNRGPASVEEIELGSGARLAAIGGDEPEEVRRLARRHLGADRLAESIELLESRCGSSDPGCQADLSALYLEHAVVVDRPLDLFRALQASSRVGSEIPAAVHNRLAVLERLSLQRVARQEAAGTGHEVPEPTEDAHKNDRAHLRAGLLQALAELDCDSETALERVADRAAELATVSSDPYWVEATADLATASRRECIERFRAGAHALIEAERQRRAGLGAAAAETAGLAGRLLEPTGTPLVHYSRLIELAIEMRNDYASGLVQLESYQAEVEGLGYRWLGARAGLFAGIASASIGRESRAIDLLESTLPNLEVTSSPAETGSALSILGSLHSRLGEEEAAWRRLLGALRTTCAGPSTFACLGVLTDATDAMSRRGRGELALLFARENVLLAEELGHRLGEAYARRDLASALLLTGASDRAADEIRTARQVLGSLDDPSRREELAASIDLLASRTLVREEPSTAAAAIREALAAEARLGRGWHEVPARWDLSLCHRRLGDRETEHAELVRGLEAGFTRRGSAARVQYRALALEPLQPFFDRLIGLELELSTRPELESLHWASLARARTLLELADLRETAEALPAAADSGIAAMLRRTRERIILFYRVQQEKVLVWRLHAGRIELSVLEDAERIERLAQAFRVVRGKVGSETAGRLGELLLDSVLDAEDEGRELLIVPDGELARIPFAALTVPWASHALIELFTVAMSPALEFAARADPISAASVVALVVADPAPGLAHTLPRLSSARREAAEVAALYERSTVLVGEQATADAFLSQAAGATVLHLATHAIAVPGSVGRSALLLAPSGSHSGRLVSEDLWQLDLSSVTLVALASCSSADDLGAVREPVHQLAAGFMAAGARSVVGSLWAVDDESSREWMVAFHEAFRRSGDPRTAYREVALRWIRERPGAALPWVVIV